MEDVQCKTCGNKITELSKHLCTVLPKLVLKGPMDEGFDICAEVRKFLQEYDERKAEARGTT